MGCEPGQQYGFEVLGEAAARIDFMPVEAATAAVSIRCSVMKGDLGHAPGSKVTMVHYTHSVSEDGRIAAAKMGKLLSAAVQ